MKPYALIVTMIELVVVLPACTADSVKRGTYEAVYQKQCVDETRAPNCDSDHKSYDEYKRERDDALKREKY